MKRFACALLFLLASVTNLQTQTPFVRTRVRHESGLIILTTRDVSASVLAGRG